MLTARIRKLFANAARAGAADDSASADDFTLDVDFVAPPGVTILFGASGSGKTMTLKSIAGLVRPDEGHISVGGRVLFDAARRVSLPARERGAGYVFQNLALFPHLTALANVEFPLSRLPRARRRERALALLESFRVAHAARRLPRNISGGEAQRVALARALASEPRVLLLDEPLSALDEAVKSEIIGDLKRLNRELRLPILYVTHDRGEALALGERALVYERGRVVAAGEPDGVFGAPLKESVARLTGAENVFEGVILSRSDEAGTMTVGLGEGHACRIEIPLGREREGAVVVVAVRSGDVWLAVEEPRGVSARNVLAGRITAVEEGHEQTRVRVRAGVEWVASVTRQSVRELRIEAGRDVWLAFKTYSCRVLDRD